MNALTKLTLFSAMLIASTGAQFAQAQVRDAGAKVRGDYSFFSGGMNSSFTTQPRAYRAAVTSVVPQAVAPTQSRRYSLNTTQPQPNCAAVPADMPSMAQRSVTAARRFSYESAAPVQRPSAIGVVPTRSAAERSAASKVLGQY